MLLLFMLLEGKALQPHNNAKKRILRSSSLYNSSPAFSRSSFSFIVGGTSDPWGVDDLCTADADAADVVVVVALVVAAV